MVIEVTLTEFRLLRCPNLHRHYRNQRTAHRWLGRPLTMPQPVGRQQDSWTEPVAAPERRLSLER